MSSAMTTGLLAFGFGAICMLLGFFLIVRGIGASDSESTIKLIGIEIRTSRVGPGVLFSLFGLVLTIIAIQKLPSDQVAAAPQPVSSAAQSAASATPAAASTAEAAKSSAPAAPATSAPPALAPDVANTQQASNGGQTDNDRRQQEAGYVRQALTSVAGGACPSEIMEQSLFVACVQQLRFTQANLYQVGPIQSISYVGQLQTPFGVADTFAVQHVNAVVVWKVILSDSGKLQRLWYGTP